MPRIAFVSQPRDRVVAAESQHGSVTTVLWELATRIARRHETLVLAPRAAGQAAEGCYGSWLTIRRLAAWRSVHKALDLGTVILGPGARRVTAERQDSCCAPASDEGAGAAAVAAPASPRAQDANGSERSV
jgi:hypothetical protein